MLVAFGSFLPTLLGGALITLKVSLASLVMGLFFGLVLAVLATYGSRVVKKVVGVYVQTMRGLPDLLIIFVAYFGGTALISRLYGGYVEVDGFSAGVAALTLTSGAYFCEILRGAFNAVPQGQYEAGISLGLTKLQTVVLILVPQMLVRAIPGLGNQWLVLLKESALVSVVGLDELMRETNIAAAATEKHLEFYVMAAAIYIIMTGVSSMVLAGLESRYKRTLAK